MASDTLSGLLKVVKDPSANLTENANFLFSGREGGRGSSVADPGFPRRGGANPKGGGGGANLLFGQFVPKTS